MKNRILYGWTLSRLLYLCLGILVIIQAIIEKQWIGIPFGAYFAIMGVFALGCAGGNCYGKTCTTPDLKTKTVKDNETIFEEIK